MIRSGTWALVILTTVNYLNYIDRFVLSSLLNTIKIDLVLTDAQAGLLGTAFMLPYFLTAPIFGRMGDIFKRNIIVGSGVVVWSLATILSGISPGYRTLFASRSLLGVGESAFTVISPAWITEFFAVEKRGRMMSVFQAALPVGGAIGYLLGGVLAEYWGWRKAFWAVSIPGFFFSIFVFMIVDQQKEKIMKVREKFTYEIFKTFFITNGGYITAVLGFCAYTFVVGGLAHWMPTFLQRYYGYSPSSAGLIFGGIAIASGFIGTLVGGWLGDYWEEKTGNGYAKLCGTSMLLAIPSFIAMFSVSEPTIFLVLTFITELLFFVSTSPINIVFIQSVPIQYRSSAMAFAVFMCHLLGDAISAPLIGYVSDVTGSLSMGIWICIPFVVLSALFWTASWCFFWRAKRWPTKSFKLPLLQSHRGCWLEGLTENTLPAFIRAQESGFMMIELDVRLSSDRIPVVIHDSDLSRLLGVKKKVKELSAQELKRIGNIPSLEEVLSHPQVPNFINIEIKNNEIWNGEFESIVAELIKKTNSDRRVIFSSFNPFSLFRLSRILPDVPRGILVNHEEHVENKWYLRKMILAFFARAHLLHINEKRIDPQFIKHCSLRQLPIVAWTVCDSQREAMLQKWGVSSLIVDKPYKT